MTLDTNTKQFAVSLETIQQLHKIAFTFMFRNYLRKKQIMFVLDVFFYARQFEVKGDNFVHRLTILMLNVCSCLLGFFFYYEWMYDGFEI